MPDDLELGQKTIFVLSIIDNPTQAWMQLRERLCKKAERRRSDQSCTHAKYNDKKIILEIVSGNFNSI